MKKVLSADVFDLKHKLQKGLLTTVTSIAVEFLVGKAYDKYVKKIK